MIIGQSNHNFENIMKNRILVDIAKKMMNAFPAYPDKKDYRLAEIFNHHYFKNASNSEKNKIKIKSAKYMYETEKEFCLFDKYFSRLDAIEFKDKNLLDLGSFTGGKLIYWKERFCFRVVRGIDINPVFACAGKLFSSKMNINADFDTGVGENLPYQSNYFDYILSSDVFEHVQNLEKVMTECLRVLKPGGKLLCVFPAFFQPFEAHLDMITRIPALHWIFPGKIISQAYHEITLERGDEAKWYSRDNSGLDEWEKLPWLNGITVRKFRQHIHNCKKWKVIDWRRIPLFYYGKGSNNRFFKAISLILFYPAHLPFLEEILLARVSCILEKKN